MMRDVGLSILSLFFVMFAPFLAGGLLPIVGLMMGYNEKLVVLGFMGYIIVYFWIWGSWLDCGRKLVI